LVATMPGMFDNSTVNQVQQANDIVDVISEHVNLVKKGREMIGLCPFHDDHSPSLYVNGAKQIFKCFACGAGGSIFTFVQMRENLTFPQAIERLAERAGIKLKPVRRAKGKIGKSADVDPNRLAKANAWAAKYFQENLNDQKKGKQARDYIAKRQITPDSAKKWQLGLAIAVQDDLIRTAKGKKVPMELLEKAGLVTGQYQDKFVNRLMFPITDVTGRVIGFGGRTLDETSAKYINSPTTALFDKSNSLYGLEQARHQIVSTGTAVVVEGYTDCIMAHSKGCNNVVATLGTSFTTGHGRMLRRYAKQVVLIFDSDTAGTEAANRALEVCLSQRIDIKLASVPEGKDPCDFLLAAGKEGFERLVNEAVDVFEFKWNRLMERFGSDDTLAGRRLAIEEYLQTIATCLWSGYLPLLDKGLILNRLSKITGLDIKEINAELSRRANRMAKTADRNVQKRKVQSADYGQGLWAAAQREILEVLLNEPQLYESVKQKITAEVFDVPILRQIANILFETLGADINTSPAEILAKTESVEVSSSIVDLTHTGEQKGNFKSRLSGALAVLEQYQNKRQKNQIKAIEDPRQFLERIREHSGKRNPHSTGMV